MFYSKYQKGIHNQWYPQAVLVGQAADTQEIAEIISSKTTLTVADVHAVIRALPEEIARIMAEGRAVKLEGLGSFQYTITASGNGVSTPEEVSARQIKGVRVKFKPARKKRGQNKVSPLIGNITFQEWIDPKKVNNDKGDSPT